MNIIKCELEAEKYPYSSVIELMFDRLRVNSNAQCMIDCTLNRRWNKSQVLESSLNFAYYLITECEVKNEDIVMFVKSNSDSHAIGLIGVMATGAIYCSVPDHSSPREIKEVCETINPNVIICSSQKYEQVKIAASNFLSIKKILVIDEQTENIELTFDKIFNKERKSDLTLPRTRVFEDIIIITMSSGSTGRPKAILKTNKNLLSQLASMQHPEICPQTEQDTFLSNGLFHAVGQAILFACINTGALLALTRLDEDHKQTFEAIHEHSITTALLLPTQLNFLSRNHEIYTRTYLKSLRDVFTGGSFLAETTHNTIVKLYDWDKFRIRYGMSEIGFGLLVYNKDSKNLSDVTTIGKVCPGFEAKIIDQDGNALGPKEHGELCFRGDQVTPGYLNNANENAKLFTHDNFMRSGDICYYDENYFIYYIGRMKEIIKVDGIPVAPAELEGILLQNQEVENAAVIGINDQEFGEIPMAFVKLTKGSSLTREEIQKFVDDHVNNFKKLRGGVRILENLPLTPFKKINKMELKKSVSHII